MPWITVPFDPQRCALIRDKYGILGIPTLVIIDPEGRIVTNKGRDHVMTHGSGAYEIWIKRRVEVMEGEEKIAQWYADFNEKKRQDRINAGLDK